MKGSLLGQYGELHYRECTRYQQAKLPDPAKAPSTLMPVGQPWQMVAVDIVEVPVSYKNIYLLVAKITLQNGQKPFF